MSSSFLLALGLYGVGCERGSVDEPSVNAGEATPQVEEGAPQNIDADWVASKFQAPPPEPPKDWLREIEKDPIEALKHMGPSALQARPAGSAPEAMTPIRAKNPAKYEPDAPLQGWPPVVGRFYPDLALEDQTGQVTAISDLRGKVVLLEVVGMTCKACNAFSGGNDESVGGFGGIRPQPGLESIDHYLQRFSGVPLDDPRLVFVQLVLYGTDGRTAPTEADVRAWASHFGLDRNRNQIVLTGDARFVSPETRRLIPGFHLIDRNGILRALSSNDPKHDHLFDGLLPKVKELL